MTAPRPFSLTVSTRDDTAGSFNNDHSFSHSHPTIAYLVAPGDYGAVINETIEFQTGDSSAEHTITIVNDDECEIDNEQFFSDIIGHSGIGYINVTEPSAQIVINDQDEVECSKSIKCIVNVKCDYLSLPFPLQVIYLLVTS